MPVDSPYNPDGFQQAITEGRLTGYSVIHKFGKNTAVGTTFVPVALGGVYQTPQAGSATALRVKAGGNAADDAAGNGAREITLEGIDASGNVLIESVATAGASASSATSGSFMRLYRAYVSASGTYATVSAGSHTAAITIENSAGGTDWATISATDFPRSQTEIGAYTIPDGYTGYLNSAYAFTDSTKTTTLLFFQRTSILQTSAPYDAMRMVFEEKVEGGESDFLPPTPIKFTGPCDVGFMAKVNTGTAEVDVDFQIVLKAD